MPRRRAPRPASRNTSTSPGLAGRRLAQARTCRSIRQAPDPRSGARPRERPQRLGRAVLDRIVDDDHLVRSTGLAAGSPATAGCAPLRSASGPPDETAVGRAPPYWTIEAGRAPRAATIPRIHTHDDQAAMPWSLCRPRCASVGEAPVPTRSDRAPVMEGSPLAHRVRPANTSRILAGASPMVVLRSIRSPTTGRLEAAHRRCQDVPITTPEAAMRSRSITRRCTWSGCAHARGVQQLELERFARLELDAPERARPPPGRPVRSCQDLQQARSVTVGYRRDRAPDGRRGGRLVPVHEVGTAGHTKEADRHRRLPQRRPASQDPGL